MAAPDPLASTDTRSVADCRELDRRAIEEFGIPGILLMEHASIGAALVALDLLGAIGGDHRTPSIGVVCGPGNNGGDGFAVARHLRNAGFESVTTYDLAPDGCGPETDAAVQRRLVDAMSVPRIRCDAAFEPAEEPALWIDAIFGTGLGRPATGRFERAIEIMNEHAVPTLAIDVPSGLDADRGSPLGATVRATATATFGVAKTGYPRAAEWIGRLHVVSIGLPPTVRPPGAPGFPPIPSWPSPA